MAHEPGKCGAGARVGGQRDHHAEQCSVGRDPTGVHRFDHEHARRVDRVGDDDEQHQVAHHRGAGEEPQAVDEIAPVAGCRDTRGEHRPGVLQHAQRHRHDRAPPWLVSVDPCTASHQRSRRSVDNSGASSTTSSSRPAVAGPFTRSSPRRVSRSGWADARIRETSVRAPVIGFMHPRQLRDDWCATVLVQ